MHALIYGVPLLFSCARFVAVPVYIPREPKAKQTWAQSTGPRAALKYLRPNRTFGQMFAQKFSPVEGRTEKVVAKCRTWGGQHREGSISI